MHWLKTWHIIYLSSISTKRKVQECWTRPDSQPLHNHNHQHWPNVQISMCFFCWIEQWVVEESRGPKALLIWPIVICLKFSESIYCSRWSSAFTKHSQFRNTQLKSTWNMFSQGQQPNDCSRVLFDMAFPLLHILAGSKQVLFKFCWPIPPRSVLQASFSFLQHRFLQLLRTYAFLGKDCKMLSQFIRVVRQSKKVVDVLQCCASYNSPTFWIKVILWMGTPNPKAKGMELL